MASTEGPEGCPYVERIEPARMTRVAPPVRLAVAGKGGSGKTTIAGTLARVLARSGRPVVAVDADTNPGLAGILGIAGAVTSQGGLVPLPRSLMKREQKPDGTISLTFTRDAEEVLGEYGSLGPDAVRLVVMGAVGQGGAG